ncbi:zinc ribbon domain-containing protein [Micromonospora zamorensis]|uniref:zinc ribbon domain-containing protein n=1 Tax=Micromonospora zamorensis TaxID=709883 RepID=UPI003D952DE7
MADGLQTQVPRRLASPDSTVRRCGGPGTGFPDTADVVHWRQRLYWERQRTVEHAVTKSRHCARNPYVFRGLIYCAACDRRMQGQYSHGDAYYRCRFPQEYALANQVQNPSNVYLREDTLTDPLDTWLASAFAAGRIEQTITAMTDAQPPDQPPPLATAAQTIIKECDAKLERYRAALDAGADPAVVTEWISQTQAERARARAEADLHAHSSNRPRRMSRTEIKDLVQALGDIAAVLRDADPTDKAEVYRQLGLRLIYQPETQTVRAAVDLSAHRGAMVCVRGGIRTLVRIIGAPFRVHMLIDYGTFRVGSTSRAHYRA